MLLHPLFVIIFFSEHPCIMRIPMDEKQHGIDAG